MHLSDDELYELIENKKRERCLKIHAEMRSKGRRFKGLTKLLKEQAGEPAKSWEAHFGIKPTVSEPCKWRRLAALERDREWERQYAEARAALQRREPAVFPPGTWLLHVLYNVRVARPQAPP